MPISPKQKRGEIIYALLHSKEKVISQEEMYAVMERSGVETDSNRKDYTEELIEAGAITRVPGGWELTSQSRRTGTITIRVTPLQNKGAVATAVAKALRPFSPLATLEIEG